MRCEAMTRIMNDLLDNTLSAGEVREIEDHLVVCESCRSEFQKLKRADDILREVVCEMVSGIEVPPDLGFKIEKIMAGEQRKKSLAGRFPMLLKTPAAAAALLFVMISVVILSFYNPFSPAEKQSDVVLVEPQVLSKPESGSVTDSSGPPVMREEARAVAESVVSEKNETRAAQDKVVVGDTGRAPEVKLREQPNSALTARVPQVVEKSPLPQEKRSLIASGGFAASGAPALKMGTLEEAAREVGFNPARPAYLPQGTDLHDVAWLAGTVYQNYRTGQISFSISQSRTDMERLKLDEGFRRGTSIEINGAKAVLQESGPKADDNSLETITVRWQRDEWAFSVTGSLPGDEIIRIASSLK